MSIDPNNPSISSASERARVVNRGDAAKILGVSPATLHRMVASGHMPSPIRLSVRRIGWQVGVLQDWLAAQSRPRVAA
jgi:predicted DNA-binding transcriptional regulator AlpA